MNESKEKNRRLPSKEEVKSFYDDFLEELKGDERGNLRHEFIKEVIKPFIRPGMKALDLGCGIGITTNFLRSLGADVIGVDISPKLCSYARERFGLEVVCSDILDLDLEKKFDFILMADVVEHIPCVFHNKLFEVLNKHSYPGTMVFVFLPNPVYTDYVRASSPEKLQIIDESVDVGEFVSKSEEAGFELIYLSLYGIECPEQYINLILRRRLSSQQKEAIWSKVVK